MKGLTCDFTLDKGAFRLLSGPEKTRAGIWFLLNFDKRYPYDSSFGTSLLSLLQKPVSYLLTNRTLIIGEMQRKVEKYVGGVSVDRIDIGHSSGDRSRYTVELSYTSSDKDGDGFKDVIFV